MDSSRTKSNFPDIERLSAKFEGSFAYLTVKDRLPIIITKIIDHLHREKNNLELTYGQEARDEIKAIIGSLSKLKNELMTDKPAIPIKDFSRSPDVEIWNEYLNNLTTVSTKPPSWFTSPWLFMECYMYRRIREAFEGTNSLTNYDPFGYQKKDAFTDSLLAIEILANYLSSFSETPTIPSAIQQQFFLTFLKTSLWGNRCDLSVSAGSENSQKDDPLSVLSNLQNNILVDDSLKIWDLLQKICSDNTHGAASLSYVLDNAGYELFTDLCLADFLCSAKLVSCVHFHVKCIPWYVSDTTEFDFFWILKSMNESKISVLQMLSGKWQDFIREKTWVIEKDIFWTLPHDFSEMKEFDPNLYKRLSDTDLIIFKGDLNYRKLTGDGKWDSTTSFEVALRGFNPSPLCALRTLKADVIVGLTPGQADKTSSQSKNWMVSGDFAVIQFCDLKLK